MKECKECGNKASDDAIECVACGQKFPTSIVEEVLSRSDTNGFPDNNTDELEDHGQRFCVECGREIPFDAIICPYCKYDYTKGLEPEDEEDQPPMEVEDDLAPCPTCGTEIPVTSEECLSCGQQFEVPEEEQIPPTVLTSRTKLEVTQGDMDKHLMEVDRKFSLVEREKAVAERELEIEKAKNAALREQYGLNEAPPSMREKLPIFDRSDSVSRYFWRNIFCLMIWTAATSLFLGAITYIFHYYKEILVLPVAVGSWGSFLLIWEYNRLRFHSRVKERVEEMMEEKEEGEDEESDSEVSDDEKSPDELLGEGKQAPFGVEPINLNERKRTKKRRKR